MRVIRIVATLALLFLAGCGAAPKPPTADPLGAKLKEYLVARTELGRFSGAVLVRKNNQTVFREGFGFADIASHTPFIADTQVPVASISKMFTAMAVLKLRDQGKLRLTDSLCNFVDDRPPAWKPVTLQHLLRHTSGIPDYEARLELGSPAYLELMGRADASRRIVADARKRELDFAPGAKFRYSNTGYVLVGFIVERVAGKPFADVIAESILEPAGMTSSGVFGGKRKPVHLASGYTYESLPWEKFLPGVALDSGFLHAVPALPLTPPSGDAGVFSNVDDLARWSAAMDDEKLVPNSLAADIFTPGLEGYGYGWEIGSLFDQRRQRHNGILPGFVSDFIRFPDQNVSIVIVCNMDRARLSSIARDVSAIVFGKPFDMPVHGSQASPAAAEFEALAGEFRAADGAHYSVRKDPDMLLIERKGTFTAGLIPLSATTFYMPLADGMVSFTPGPNGRAQEVNLRFGGEDHRARASRP